MNRLALFDCDGTLVDGQAVICRAMELCFADHGHPAPDRATVRRIIGLSLPQAMAVLLPGVPAERHALLAEAYKQSFHTLRRAGPIEEPIYDGIADLLDALEAAGWVCGIATGKSDRGLALVLEKHGLGARFVTLQTADRHPSKPHPAMIEAAMAEAGAAPDTTVMIGDTSFDMMMARAAGARAIGVGWGYHDAGELIAAGAEAVAADAEELGRLLGVR